MYDVSQAGGGVTEQHDEEPAWEWKLPLVRLIHLCILFSILLFIYVYYSLYHLCIYDKI